MEVYEALQNFLPKTENGAVSHKHKERNPDPG